MIRDMLQDLKQYKIRLGGLAIAMLTLILVGRQLVAVFVIGGHAELQQQGLNYMQKIIIRHLEKYRTWPTSWEDLQKDSQKNDAFSLPRDQVVLESIAEIRFNLSIHEVARMAPEKFDAIQLRDKPFYNYSGIFASIVDAARRWQGAEKAKGVRDR